MRSSSIHPLYKKIFARTVTLLEITQALQEAVNEKLDKFGRAEQAGEWSNPGVISLTVLIKKELEELESQTSQKINRYIILKEAKAAYSKLRWSSADYIDERISNCIDILGQLYFRFDLDITGACWISNRIIELSPNVKVIKEGEKIKRGGKKGVTKAKIRGKSEGFFKAMAARLKRQRRSDCIKDWQHCYDNVMKGASN